MALLFRLPQRMEDLALFTRHVAGAMDARAPLPQVLHAYAGEAESGGLRRVVRDLADSIESGASLSHALDDHPAVFPRAYRRLVELGEQGRSLGGVMNQLADSLEENLKTYEYFRRAAVYPILVLSLLAMELVFLMITILPRFQDITAQLGYDLSNGSLGPVPLLPRLLKAFIMLILVALGFLLATMFAFKTRGIHYDRLLLGAPLIGPVLRRGETARFANFLSLLLANHVPLPEALGLMAQASRSGYVGAALLDFKTRCESGERLSDMIATQPLFPATMAAMIAAAEDQGGLAETLRSLGRFYAERTSHGLTVLREAFEPLMLLFVGVLVALMLLSLYTPIFMLPGLIR